MPELAIYKELGRLAGDSRDPERRRFHYDQFTRLINLEELEDRLICTQVFECAQRMEHLRLIGRVMEV